MQLGILQSDTSEAGNTDEGPPKREYIINFLLLGKDAQFKLVFSTLFIWFLWQHTAKTMEAGAGFEPATSEL